ncbi:orotidine-5'-phosphate decarboxylase [sulfur-oxidizing endosymbiont of Gigantopelta aegis]|uniref:orotidine-5'-phosphate decarboxylase n=1 Tax=sulfur-oxidizing endosymbiont of Gigantopelta aegis TaxID=2794934 RepID=UPI0018DD8EC4|nr:orotidine-5'-phosphate decarboxylase [sulfur-oxidizing endosymbiont of Gigantopelta aegis]
MISIHDPKIIIALDFKDEASTMALVDQLEPQLCRLKVGKELFVRCGPALVKKLIDKGFDVFLDLKFHDIPNTVAAACQAAADMGVWMVNIHASGGRKMMQYAREAIEKSEHQPLLIGVTILTSLNRQDIAEVGLDIEPAEQVLRLAKLANESGLDGVVCSPLEVTELKQQIGSDFCLVTPGVRPAGSNIGDQQRVMTPSQALLAGSDYLVIGRPITQSNKPLEALKNILLECNML